ncbi:MAG TPA: hypothetical protein VGH87_10770 [Polyangiaceae bacterium]|jgi:hypothetical protein
MKYAFAIALAGMGCTVSTTSNFVSPPPPPPSTCATNDAIACGAGAVGYTCSSDRPDDGDTNLVCSAGAPGAGGANYCCVPFGQYFNDCTTDTTIAGCADPAFGFSCSGPTGPADVDVRLACSDAIASGAGSSYCCVPGDGSPECVAAPGAACAGASVGFSCAGNASPAEHDAPMACNGGTAGEAGATTRCCVSFPQSPTGCEEDRAACTSDQFGFSCAGLARPENGNAALTCTSSSAGPSRYCCTLD